MSFKECLCNLRFHQKLRKRLHNSVVGNNQVLQVLQYIPMNPLASSSLKCNHPRRPRVMLLSQEPSHPRGLGLESAMTAEIQTEETTNARLLNRQAWRFHESGAFRL